MNSITGNDIVAVITALVIFFAVMWILFPSSSVKKTKRDVGKVAACLPNGTLIYQGKAITYDYAMQHQIKIEMIVAKKEKQKKRSFWKVWE